MDEIGHVKSFKELGLNDWLVKQCEAMGIKRPTPIQKHCTPEILKGRGFFVLTILKFRKSAKKSFWAHFKEIEGLARLSDTASYRTVHEI